MLGTPQLRAGPLGFLNTIDPCMDSASDYYVVSLLGAIGEQWGSLCFHGSQHTILVLGNDLIINSESNRNMISIHHILYFSIGVS